MSAKKENNYVSSDNYIVIQGWMCNELELKGNDLLVYALINGFTQDGKSKYYGGRQYIANTFNISLPTVDKVLQNLINTDLIIKEPCKTQAETDVYYINISSKETLLGKNISSKETLLNNINTSKKENIDNSTNVELGQAPTVHRRLITDIPNPVSKPSVKKKSRYEQCVEVIDEMVEARYVDLKQILTDYLKMRLAIKDKPMYVSGWKALIKKLQELSQDVSEQYKIVRQSLENSWATFYPLKSNNYNKGTQNPNVFSEYGQVKAERRSDEVIVNERF